MEELTEEFKDKMQVAALLSGHRGTFILACHLTKRPMPCIDCLPQYFEPRPLPKCECKKDTDFSIKVDAFIDRYKQALDKLSK
jgi:hypothetical protein